MSVSDSGDREQLLHGHGALRWRRPDGQDLREEASGGEGGAALHPSDPVCSGSPAQIWHCAQVRLRPSGSPASDCLLTLFIITYFIIIYRCQTPPIPVPSSCCMLGSHSHTCRNSFHSIYSFQSRKLTEKWQRVAQRAVGIFSLNSSLACVGVGDPIRTHTFYSQSWALV